MTRNPGLIAAQAQLLINQLISEPLLDSPMNDELVASIIQTDNPLARQLFNRIAVDLILAMEPEAREKIGAHMNRIGDRAELLIRSARLFVETHRSDALRQLSHAETERADAAEQRLAELEASLLISRRLHEIAAVAIAPAVSVEPAAADVVVADTSKKKKRLWSELEAGFIDGKTRSVENHHGMDEGGTRQVENTLHLWRAIIGDRHMDAYDGEDAEQFRNTMLRLPASHGKSGNRAAVRLEVPPHESIRRADERQKVISARNALLEPGQAREPDVARLKMKTLKKHFSRLSQFWIYAGQIGHVPKEPNIFRGWQYQGLRRGNKRRRAWSTDDLALLFDSAWFSAEKIGSDPWWVTLIAMWSGLRAEEIARLRPTEDIQESFGVLLFKIQDHPDPERWSPKTEAGSREVPIHSELLKLGLMDLVEQRRKEGARRLFPTFRVRPSADKLSAKFVSDFSRHKISLGITPLVTFHSFRHNVSTALRNTPLDKARECWIDAILGHSPTEDDAGRPRAQSEGVKTYLDRVYIQNLKATVEAISYPSIDMSRLKWTGGDMS